MTKINITIKNLPQIKRAFGQAPALMTRGVNTAIRKSIFTVERKSKLNTPVDTGRLRASHTTLFNNLRGEVGTKTNYDIYVHDGTKYMMARPYLRTAVDDSIFQIDQFFTDELDKVLNKIGRMT